MVWFGRAAISKPKTNNLFSTVSIICISRREQVMMEAMPEAILALAAANFSAGSEFGNVVRQNVGKARVKVCYIGLSFFIFYSPFPTLYHLGNNGEREREEGVPFFLTNTFPRISRAPASRMALQLHLICYFIFYSTVEADVVQFQFQ